MHIDVQQILLANLPVELPVVNNLVKNIRPQTVVLDLSRDIAPQKIKHLVVTGHLFPVAASFEHPLDKASIISALYDKLGKLKNVDEEWRGTL